MAMWMSSEDADAFADSGCTLTLLVDAGANQAFRSLCEVSPRKPRAQSQRAPLAGAQSQRAPLAAAQSQRAPLAAAPRARREDLVAGTSRRLQQAQEG
jgi:hypothetical protein